MTSPIRIIELALVGNALKEWPTRLERLNAVAARDFGQLAIKALDTIDMECIAAASYGVTSALACLLLTVSPELRQEYLAKLCQGSIDRADTYEDVLGPPHITRRKTQANGGAP